MLGTDKNKNEELQITSQDLIEQLNILYKQKKYNIVESLAKNYLEQKSKDDGVRTVLAKALHDSGKIYEAIDHAKLIVKHTTDNSKMQLFLANCYLKIEKPMKAIEIFQEILEKDPDEVIAIKELAQVYFDTNQKRSAIKMYKRLEEFLESNQEKAKNKITIAKIHIEFAEYDLAIQEYEQILEIYPEDISVKKALVELYKKIADYDSVIEIATELNTDFPDNETGLWAIQTLMEIYKITQDYEKALEYANLIKIHPLANGAQSDENIAMIFLDEGKTEESIELLKALLAENPGNISLKKELAKAYEKNKDFNLAIDIYKKILDESQAQDINQIHYELSNLYSHWAMYAFSQNENEDCFKHFTSAIKYFDKNSDIYYRLGNVNKSIKNFNEAISQYKKAIELDSQNAVYYYALSECYKEIDSIYEQKKALSESLKYDNQNAKAHYNLSVIYNLQNDNTNAMAHIKKAIELDESYIEAKHHLALMLEHTGDKEGAASIYQEILVLDPENETAKNNLKMLNA